jgi:hypothetical protein
MVSIHMPATTFRERFAESEERIDREQFVEALTYVRDDGRSP